MSQSRFTILSSDAVFDERLNDTHLRILAAIGSYTTKDRKAWPKQTTLATRMGKDRKTINRACKRLEELGYIKSFAQYRDDGGRASNVYLVLLDQAVSGGLNLSQGGVPPQVQGCTPSGTGPVPPQVQQELDHRNSNEPPSGVTRTRARKALRGDWVPDERCISYAMEKGLSKEQIKNEIEKFNDWHDANAAKYASWPARWKHWIRMSLDRSSNRNSDGRSARGNEAFDRVKAQILRAEGMAPEDARGNPHASEQKVLDFEASDLDG